MKTLQEILDRIKLQKSQRKVIKDSIQQELEESKSYTDAKEEIANQKHKQSLVISSVMAGRVGDAEKIDRLSLSIKADNELIADVVLSMYINGTPFESEDGTKIEPRFKVTLKQPSLF